MKLLAEAYQRIKYRKLIFKVVPMASTSVNGGYTAGFIRDCKDLITEDPTSALLASGGVSKKVFDEATVVVGGVPDLYYTSREHQDSLTRWSSPGSFVVTMDSGADRSFDLLIYVDWHIELSEPVSALEKGKDTTSIVLPFLICTKDANEGAYYSSDDGKTQKMLTSEALFQSVQPVGTMVGFPNPRPYLEKTSSGTPDHVVNVYGLILGQNDHFRFLLATGRPSEDKSYGVTYLASKGETCSVKIPENVKLDFLFLSSENRRSSFLSVPEISRGYLNAYPIWNTISHRLSPPKCHTSVYTPCSTSSSSQQEKSETFSKLISSLLCPVGPLFQSPERLTVYRQRLSDSLKKLYPKIVDGEMDPVELETLSKDIFEEVVLQDDGFDTVDHPRDNEEEVSSSESVSIVDEPLVVTRVSSRKLKRIQEESLKDKKRKDF